MRKLFRLLAEVLKNGEASVLVTVTASSGSTPRGAGARMLVTGKGRIYGTIGGGAVEFQSERMALEILGTKASRMEQYRLHENQVQDLGMICGGDVNVYFRYIPAGDTAILALTERIEAMYRQSEPSWLISEITPGQDGAMSIYGEKTGLSGADVSGEVIERLESKAARLESDGRSFYCEKLVRAGVVYIFGGGHVSQALVPVLDSVDFRCVVLEDREEFCRSELFPGVEETRLIDNSRISDFVEIGADDYVVIVTRGHKDDQTVQAHALRTPARYIGVIGSRRKSAAVFANLRVKGFTEQELERITTPIGLDIKAETPAEIAISIAAQLILERAVRGM